jgi:two-component system cit operon sensor histidine kinase CitA
MLAKDTHDEICRFNDLTVIASRVRIMLEGSLQGWVITFRDRNEIDSLSAQLSQVKRYVDNLRIMRHEQLNRMTTSPACCIWAAMKKPLATFRRSRNMPRSCWTLSLRASAPRPCAACCWESRPRAGERRRAVFRSGCRLDTVPAPGSKS